MSEAEENQMTIADALEAAPEKPKRGRPRKKAAEAPVPAADAGAAEGIELTVTADKINSGDAIRVGDKTYKFGTGTDSNTVKYLDKDDAVNALKTALENDGYNVDLSGSKLTIHGTVGADAPAITGGGLTLQIGDTADDFNKMTVAVDNMSTKGLGLDGLKITSETLSSDAIAKVKTAINSVSTTRAGMGALQTVSMNRSSEMVRGSSLSVVWGIKYIRPGRTSRTELT